MISVVGGVYAERCREPHWDSIFGSGGRAAVALGSSTDVDLWTFASSAYLRDFELAAIGRQVSLKVLGDSRPVLFDYIHPLSYPELRYGHGAEASLTSQVVRGDHMVVFGMIEGRPVCAGDKVIFDPQSSCRYTENGSTARSLVYVLNLSELHILSEGSDIKERVESLFRQENATAVILKNGPLGACVYFPRGTPINIPSYRSSRVFKIGSGDLFTAAVAYFWMVKGYQLVEAATLASLSVAKYVETRDLEFVAETELRQTRRVAVEGRSKQIYLAAPFFSLEQRWLVEEALRALTALGAKVFSPLHLVGVGESGDVARADLEGLNNSSSVVALLGDTDTGTIFEIGYAVAIGKPISVFAERTSLSDLTMILGTGCKVYDDFTTALYSAMWDSIDAS